MDVYSLLRRRYPEAEYALMREVRDKAGSYANRSADYVAVNLWPSRGLEVNGFELKSFRNDWLNELKNPKKAENIFQYCDRWWLLTTDDTIAKPDEIPATWGWLCIKGSRIKVMKDAPKLTPVPISRNFFAATLKRACDKTNFVHIDSIKDKIEEAKQEVNRYNARNVPGLEKKLQELYTHIEVFEKASGISIKHAYFTDRTEKYGEVVRLIADKGIDHFRKQLADLAETSKIIHNKIENALELLTQPLEQEKNDKTN